MKVIKTIKKSMKLTKTIKRSMRVFKTLKESSKMVEPIEKKLSEEATRMLYEELEKYGPECQKKGQGSNQENVKRRLTNSLSKALTAFRDKQRYDDYKALRNEKTFPEVKKFVEEDSHHMTKAALLRSLFVKYNIANSIQGRRVQDINPPKVKPKRV